MVSDVSKEPEFFYVLIEGLSVENPIIRMCASDAMEKVSLEHLEYLMPHRQQLFELAAISNQKEVRWHMAQNR